MYTFRMRKHFGGNPETSIHYSQLLYRAGKRGLAFDLTPEEYTQIISSGKCHYCGKELPKTGHGVDRLDHHTGYIKSNCVPCCAFCNQIKGRLEGVGFSYPRTVELLAELNESRFS